MSKKSTKNKIVIDNFILYITSNNNLSDKPQTFTAKDMYRLCEEYIVEDHIVTYGAESSFQHEDKDKKFPECVVVVADFGEEGTKTVGSIDSTDVDSVNDLLEFIKDPYT